MSQAVDGAAQATPPVDQTANILTAEAKGPTEGPSSFQDYVAKLPDTDPMKAHAVKKGWKDWGDPIKAHENAERALGDKVVMPKQGDAEALKAHLQKLGAPADGKYDLKVPDGLEADPALQGAFEKFAGEMPVPLLPGQMQALWDWYHEQAKTAADASAKADEAKAGAKDAALEAFKAEVGPEKFEEQLNLATKAASFGGFPDDLLIKLEDTLSTKTFIECMARIGSLGTEDQFVEGHGGPAPRSAKPLENRLWPDLPS